MYGKRRLKKILKCEKKPAEEEQKQFTPMSVQTRAENYFNNCPGDS